MTVFKGVLLFDIPEPAIGKWENIPFYRGMMEVWKHSVTGEEVVLEPNDDSTEENHWDFIIQDDNGNCDCISSGTFDQVDKQAKEWMKEHPNGWKEG